MRMRGNVHRALLWRGSASRRVLRAFLEPQFGNYVRDCGRPRVEWRGLALHALRCGVSADVDVTRSGLLRVGSRAGHLFPTHRPTMTRKLADNRHQDSDLLFGVV
jgi:hypothetical protein